MNFNRYGLYHPEPVGGHDHRRHGAESDARLCRAGVAGAGCLRRHRRLCRGDHDHAGLPLIAALGVAIVLCFAIGWILGYPALRVQHHYLAFVTLAFSTLAFLVFRNEDWLTKGIYGISNIPRPHIFRLRHQPAAAVLLSLPRLARYRLAGGVVADPLALGPRLRGAARKPDRARCRSASTPAAIR